MKTNTKKMNDNLKKVCVKCFQDFLDDGFIDAGRSVFYDILVQANCISLTNSQIKKYYIRAQTLLIQQEKEGNNDPTRIGFLSGKRRLTVIFKAKTISLEEIFTKLNNEGKHLKDLLI